MDLATLRAHAHPVLLDATIPELPNHYAGKVRDNYDLPDRRRIIIATDRLSAFDRILCAVPFKGQVLTQTARFWFDATNDICPNHVLSYPDPNVVIGQRLTVLPVEIVVRDYLAGTTGTSVLTMYRAGQRDMYGVHFPEGLRDNQRLPQPIITPTSKEFDGGHDAPLTPDEIIAKGLLTAAQWTQLCDYALALFARGQAMAAERGLILADTKYEFGTDPDGRIVLADEIHTSDSSRYWKAASYQERFDAGERSLKASTRISSAIGSSVPLRPIPATTSPKSRRTSFSGHRRRLYRGVRDHHRPSLPCARRPGPGARPHPRQSGAVLGVMIVANEQSRQSSLLPALVLALLVALMAAAWFGFPYFQAWMARNDCVATGRTNC